MLILVTVLWYDIFAEPSLLGKLKKIQESALKILHNNFESY